MLKLTVFFGDKEEVAKVFSPQQLPISIGRSADCDIQIDNAVVSRKHAIIGMLGEKYVVADQDSSNGFGLNDQEDVRVAVLDDGDEIRLGKYSVKASVTVIKRLREEEKHFKKLAGEGGDLEATISMEKLASRPGASGESAHKLQITKPTNRLCPLSEWQRGSARAVPTTSSFGASVSLTSTCSSTGMARATTPPI